MLKVVSCTLPSPGWDPGQSRSCQYGRSSRFCHFVRKYMFQIQFRQVIIESWLVSGWTDQNAVVTHSMRMCWQGCECLQ